MKAKALLSFLTCCSFRPKITVLVSLCLFLLAGDLLGPLQAEGGNRGRAVIAKVFQSQSVTPGAFHGDLRDLPKMKGWQPGAPIREVPRMVPQPPRESAPPGTAVQSQGPQDDPLLQLQEAVATRTFAPPDLNFDGIPFTGAFPPDTVGEVGLNHYIQMVNDGFGGGSSVAIYDKTGTLIAGPVSLQTLWPPGRPCSVGSGDPIVLYDRLADRWLMSEFADIGNHLCVYVSQTSDPVSGGWFLYDLGTPNFPDYPKWAVWPDAYYISTNEPVGSPVYALDRTQVLLGNPATFLRTTAPDMPGFGFQALIPSDLDGPTPPPAGSPNFFMRHRDDEVHGSPLNPSEPADPTQDYLEIWQFQVDFGNPANSTFTGPNLIPVAEFDSDLCGLGSFECFPQPGTAVGLDPLREVIMWRLQYRNFGAHETLVGNFVTDVDGTDHGGIRWFELRKTGSGAWSLFQEGTHAPDSDHRWMGSIAMDKDGNIALGYSVSSDTTFPSIRYSGRRATDPSGTLPLDEVTLVAGGGSQTAATRWGDYSSMNVDPADDRTFWYTNEYIPDANGIWQTRIGVFTIEGPPEPTVSRIVLGLAGPEGQGWMEVVEKDPPHTNITWLRVPWADYNTAAGGTHPVECNLDNDPEDELVVGLDSYPAQGGFLEIRDDRNTSYVHLDWIRVPWSAYNAANGATYPACGDFDGDGRDEIAIGLGTYPAQGGWIEIKDDSIANYAHLDWIRVPRSAYNAANGATYPATGDFDGDGRDEIAVGLGTYPTEGGWVEIKDDGNNGYAHLDWIQVPWTAYNAANGATFPTAGDVDADGRDEIAVGLGTYPDAGGWFEIKDDLDAGFGHLSWGRLHWDAYNSANGETRPGLER
jgi:hypothetical protein